MGRAWSERGMGPARTEGIAMAVTPVDTTDGIPMTEQPQDRNRESAAGDTRIVPKLGLWDAVSIIVGIVVGTAIFKSPQWVFRNVGGPWEAIGIWAVGGILSLNGALCYAELATTYPRSGGDYHYLSRAFGRWMGFLFGWAQLTVILTGSIAIMAYAFADYGMQLQQASAGESAVSLWLAVAAIVTLSVVNLLGLVVGKWVQNLLSVVKVLGLLGIFLAAVFCSTRGSFAVGAQPMEVNYGLALVFVLYAFGGWNDAAFVAAEVRGQQRNLPLALFMGVGIITAIYLLVIVAYLVVLGFAGACAESTPAAAVMQAFMGDAGRKVISGLVMVSALGAINGLILTGARISAALGSDHALFAGLAGHGRRSGAPIAALITQCAISVLLVLIVGLATGRQGIDVLLQTIGSVALQWNDYGGGFEILVAGTAPVFWGFFLLTGISLFVLRWRDGDRPRPFRTPLYPLPPLIFCAMCLYMLYSSLMYARGLSILGLLPLAVGLPLYAISQAYGRQQPRKS
jgi:amino acid transporter